ncbi:MAG: hypothetical protein K0R66_1580 [Gammaproteobacteria bacterium]|nr:hypothetical protein [Gammaproteobacteria bacterium]
MQASLTLCNCRDGRTGCNCTSIATKENITRSAMTVSTIGSCLAQIKANKPLTYVGSGLGIAAAFVSAWPKIMSANANIKEIKEIESKLGILHNTYGVIQANRDLDNSQLPKYPSNKSTTLSCTFNFTNSRSYYYYVPSPQL